MDAGGILQAGGFLVQMMPGADEELSVWMQERIAGFPDVTWLMEEGFDPRQMLDLLMGDPAIRYLDTRPCGYRCDCSHERMARSLAALGAKDLAELMDDPDGIELTCHFCGGRHHFTQDELAEIASHAELRHPEP